MALLDPPRRVEPRDDEPLLVKLSSILLERTRDFFDVWLALGVRRMLGLDELLGRLIEPGCEDVAWATIAAILTIARFCEPSSELHIIGILPDTAREVFQIPGGVQPVTALAIGYAADRSGLPENLRARDLATHTRRTLSEFVFAGAWGTRSKVP